MPETLFGNAAWTDWKSLSILAVGGFLVGFGARYAGGCTSGHAISGLSNLQLPSLIAVIGFFIGILFGITLFKSEAASWFRIYEMFQFKSFHMYGIIGSALALGVIITQSIKRFKIKSFYGNPVDIADKPKLLKSNLYGGIIFGLGWAQGLHLF